MSDRKSIKEAIEILIHAQSITTSYEAKAFKLQHAIEYLMLRLRKAKGRTA